VVISDVHKFGVAIGIAPQENMKSFNSVTASRNARLKQTVFFSEILAQTRTTISISHIYVFRRMVGFNPIFMDENGNVNPSISQIF